MTFQPRGQEPVLWLSKFAKFVPGKSIRGAIRSAGLGLVHIPQMPTCLLMGSPARSPGKSTGAKYWPAGNPDFPEVGGNDTTKAQWPHSSEVQIIITTGPELRVELITRNTGETSFLIGDAFHTYFQVSDIRQVSIHGWKAAPSLIGWISRSVIYRRGR